nr:MAG TPA: Transcription attenuation protein [Caudoviricetes sp.]
MSNIKTKVTLEAPTFNGHSRYYIKLKDLNVVSNQTTVAKESLVSCNHKCNKCQGNGYFWSHNSYNEPVKEPCSMCGGTGVLDAVVTIEWKQQINNK